jgi:hypothetical protein
MAMIQRSDILIDDYWCSLSKLVSKKITDIIGYPASESGEYFFQIIKIIFEDGTDLWVGAEHDCAYLESYGKDFPNLDSDVLKTLRDPDEVDEEDEEDLSR